MQSECQESYQGLPAITNYISEDFQSIEQTWDAAQTENGVIFFGNTNGVLRFDGTSWTLKPISRFMSIVRSLERNDKGILFVGSINNFGYLDCGNTNSLEFVSLSSQLPATKASFNDVWHIACLNDITVFLTSQYLFVFEDMDLIEIIEAKERFTKVIALGESLYMHDKGAGLCRWENNSFKVIEGGEFFKGKTLSFLLAQDEDVLLAGTINHGIFSISHGIVSEWGNSIIRSNKLKLTCGISLSNNTYAVGASGVGVIFINDAGEVIRSIGIRDGLISNGITNLYTDHDQNLWVTTDNGISFVELCSPFSYYLKPYGLTQPVMESVWFDGQLYISGTDAVYSMDYSKPENPFDEMSFTILEGSEGQSWQAKSDDSMLYFPHNPGLLSVKGNYLKSWSLNYSNVYNIVFPGSHPDKFIVSVDNGLLLCDKDEFMYRNIWKGKETPRYIVLHGNDELWMITETLQGVYRLRFTTSFDSVLSMEWYGTHKGLPDQAALSVLNTKTGISVLTEQGLFRYDTSMDGFMPDTCGSHQIPPGAFLANTDALKNVWLGGMNYLVLLQLDSLDRCVITDTIFKRLHAFNVYHGALLPDTSWLFSSNKGVIRYNPTPCGIPNLRSPIINEVVSITGDSILFLQEFLQSQNESTSDSNLLSSIPEISYSGNSFRFICASVCYVEPRQCMFRYRLEKEGQGRISWSAWTDSHLKEYTNLPEGEYTFSVSSKDVFGQISQETIFRFVVLPPWYRTYYAFVAYFLFTIILFYLVIRIKTLHLKRANIRLEKIISERTHEIERQKSEIQTLNEFKTRFYSNISHELRTPLTLITSPLEQLANKAVDPMLKKSYAIMLRNARRLMELITQMLELSKIEKGEIKLNLVNIDIVPVLSQIVESFSLHAASKGIQLTFTKGEPSVFLDIDQDILEKIIHNLLSNAIKFTKNGGSASVSVKHSKDKKQVCIKVADSGVGISNDELGRIFDRFYQVDGPDGFANEGVGIGLAFVKELVEMHQGEISVVSELNKGTTFTIDLPLKALEVPSVKNGEKAFNTEKFTETAKYENRGDKEDLLLSKSINTKEIILVVEDNEDMLNFIADSLPEDFKILKARDGTEGFSVALNEMPDVIITDVMMPNMNGIEMTRELKNNRLTSHIPIIMLTAKGSEDSKIEGLEAMADDYLTKPFSVRELVVRIKNLIVLRNRLKRKYQDELLVNPAEVTTSTLDEAFLSKAIQVVEEQMSNENFAINILCDELAMSRPTLHRKLKALTNQSATEFINSIRLKHAARLIRQNAGNISEIAYKVGFNNVPYFNVSFKKQFGVTPSDFK